MQPIEEKSLDFNLGRIAAKLDENDRVHEEIKELIRAVDRKLDAQNVCALESKELAAKSYTRIEENSKRLDNLEDDMYGKAGDTGTGGMKQAVVSLKTKAGYISAVIAFFTAMVTWLARTLITHAFK